MAFINFDNTTSEKVAAYLGYPYSNAENDYIIERLTAVDTMQDDNVPWQAAQRINGWLSQLDTIQTNINTERDIEGTTKLPNLRYEGRRLVSLIGNALGLEVRFDIFSSGAGES